MLGLHGVNEPKETFGTHSAVMYICPFLVNRNLFWDWSSLERRG